MLSRKQVAISALGALTLFVGMTGVARANLITNGGFETGDFTGWTFNAFDIHVGTAGQFTNYDPHSGNFLALLGTSGSLAPLSQSFNDVAGGTLNVSLFLNSNGLTPNQITVEIDGTILFSQTDIPDTGNGGAAGYFQVTGSALATGHDTLTILERDDPDFIALDDVSVTETVPEPASLAILGTALAGFGWMRRRKAA